MMKHPQFQNSPEREHAATVTRHHNHRVAAIRKDRHLTREGKAAHIAASFVAARDKLADLRRIEAERIATRREALARKLFRIPSDPASQSSFRDSQDRADKLANSKQAFEAMNKADLSGDKLMIMAVVRKAAECGWNTVIDSYAQVHGLGDEFGELASLAEYDTPTSRLEQSMNFSLSKPPELGGHGGEIDQLAARVNDPANEVQPPEWLARVAPVAAVTYPVAEA